MIVEAAMCIEGGKRLWNCMIVVVVGARVDGLLKWGENRCTHRQSTQEPRKAGRKAKAERTLKLLSQFLTSVSSFFHFNSDSTQQHTSGASPPFFSVAALGS